MSESTPQDQTDQSSGTTQAQDPPIDLGSANVEKFLEVGLVAVVDMQPNDAASQRYEGTIVGWKPNSFIIWQTRVDPKRPWRIVHDDLSVMRFFSNGRACAVKCYLMDWQARGATRIVYLTWPEQVAYRVVRRQGRVETELLCEATLKSGATIWGTVLQLSADGCRVYLPMKNVKDAPQKVSFALPNGIEVTDVPMDVRHASPTRDGVCFGCSIDLGTLRKETRNALLFFIDISLRTRDIQKEGSRIGIILAKPNDDHEELRAELHSREVEVVAAHGVIECYAWLQGRGAGAVYIDGEISETSPIEIAKVIRQSAVFQSVPVYVVGGNESELKPEAEKIGAKYLGSLAPSPELLDSITKQLSGGAKAG